MLRENRNKILSLEATLIGTPDGPPGLQGKIEKMHAESVKVRQAGEKV